MKKTLVNQHSTVFVGPGLLKSIKTFNAAQNPILPISGQVDKGSAIETVDWVSISYRVTPKTIKIGIHSSMLDAKKCQICFTKDIFTHF